MHHDFARENGGNGNPGSSNSCNQDNHIMGYGEKLAKSWSSCSRDNFRAHFANVQNSWCLDSKY